MAVTFDGAGDFVTCNDSASLSAINPLTIMLWQKTGSTENSYNGWITKYATSNREWMFTFRPSDGYVAFFVFDEDAGAVRGNYYSPDTGIRDDNWHFMAAVWNGGTTSATDFKVYKDGVAVGIAFPSDTGIFIDIEPLGADVLIGHGHLATEFDGEMSNVTIINRELSVGEIRSEMYRSHIPESNTKLCCRLDEMSDNTAPGGVDCADISGNGNHGTFLGDPQWVDGPPVKILHE